MNLRNGRFGKRLKWTLENLEFQKTQISIWPTCGGAPIQATNVGGGELDLHKSGNELGIDLHMSGN